MATIGILGAGSIGCYVGGRLAASGSEVVFYGRPRLQAELQAHGLTLSDLDGVESQVPADRLRYETDPACLAECDWILVTVKSAATAEAAKLIADNAKPRTIIVSFQNGIHNAAELAGAMPEHTVITGMIPFNVVNQGQGHFHQGSEGRPEIQSHEALAPLRAAFVAAGHPLIEHTDMAPVLWAKLLLNLNNALNALADIPLKEELSQRAYRQCLALCQAEGLGLLQQARITPAKLTPLPAHWIPRLLTVPDWLFRLLGNRMLAIDPLARSSMWEDLQQGRRTEIDWLNGEFLRLAESLGGQAPVNARMVELIRAAESGQGRAWTGTALLAELRQAEKASG